MVTTVLTPAVDLQSFSNSGEGPVTENQDEAREVARQFEALLIRTMLKSMRTATPGDGFLNSDQADMYLEMFDQNIAEEISMNGNFGLQDSIYRQLTTHSNSINAIAGALNTNNFNQAAAARPLSPASQYSQLRNDGPAGFVDRVSGAAKKAADKLGTSINAVIAVAALETGWGKRIPKTENGQSTHNLFGIKADSRWRGPSNIAKTTEYRMGEMTTEAASFRAYRSEFESVEDFANFLTENPRYRQALETASDSEGFIRELQKAGYATDPDYADKVISIMKDVAELTAE